MKTNTMGASNNLIAEFMGKPYRQEFLEKGVGGVFEEVVLYEDLQYHSSWDWLMPVVQKCRQENRLEYFDRVYYALEECDINVTYKAVVEFIKDQNKKENDY